MKKISKAALGLSALLALAAMNLPAQADALAYMTVTSPDHPTTWASGAHQSSKVLRWDSSRQMLVVDVKYSTGDYADSVNSTRTDDHNMAFPTVRLAENGKDLLATNHRGETAAIGRLENGLFGKEVVLDKGVDLNVHRVDGAIHASLVYNALMAR